MERLERRPMTQEERADWTKRIRQSQATDHRCRTCSEPATICFGDVLGDDWYCHGHEDAQRSRRGICA